MIVSVSSVQSHTWRAESKRKKKKGGGGREKRKREERRHLIVGGREKAIGALITDRLSSFPSALQLWEAGVCRSEWGGGVRSGGGGGLKEVWNLICEKTEGRKRTVSLLSAGLCVLVFFSQQQQTAGQEVRCQELRFVMCDK